MECWSQLRATPVARNQDLMYKTVPCESPKICWEGTPPFQGGSVPWRGTISQRDAADAATQEDLEPECVWARAQGTCPQFSCSGYFDLRKSRPTCDEITQPRKKKVQQWCWDSENTILPHAKCPPPAWACPKPEVVDEQCPAKPLRHIPLFLWHHGFVIPNISHVPYASYREGLEWKNPAAAEKLPPKDVSLWSLGCMSSVPGPPAEAVEEAAERAGTRMRRCPGRGKPTRPLFLWSDGYCKFNDVGLPYPGHGPRPFDFCEYRYGRPSYPSKKAIQKAREKKWKESDYCCKAALRQPEWCSSMDNTCHITAP